ncbi:MAG: protein kinase [Anaerolineae bacterium]|nr:protein kinase [Anaerolineae bacterium]
MQSRDFSGQTFGQYQILELIGQGGMGAVYRAKQITLDVERAIKILPAEFAQHPDYTHRFTREAKTAAGLQHPNIVSVIDYGTYQGNSYLVMPLLSGGSLSDRLEQRLQGNHPLPSLSEVARLLTQIASALDYAHGRGVIHRDIKDSNIMFDDQGNAYIADFGIAKLMYAATRLTTTNMTIGTPAYMSPEQWQGGSGIEAPTDQYALGVLIYQLLSGEPPFQGDTPFQLMHKHLYQDPEPIQQLRDDVPEALQAILARAMAKDPDDRYPTVSAFADAFREAIHEVGSTAETQFFTMPIKRKSTKPTAGRSGVYGAPPPPLPLPVPPDRRLIFGGVIAAVMIAIALLAFLAANLNQDAEDPALIALAASTDLSPTLTLTSTITETAALTPTIEPVATNTSTAILTPTLQFTASPTTTPRPTVAVENAGSMFRAGGASPVEVMNGAEIVPVNALRYLIADGGRNLSAPGVLYLSPQTGLTLADIDDQEIELLLDQGGDLFIESGQFSEGGITVILAEDRNIRYTANAACMAVFYEDRESPSAETTDVNFSCYGREGNCQVSIGSTEIAIPDGSRIRLNLAQREQVDETVAIDYAEALRYYEMITEAHERDDQPACLIPLVDPDQDSLIGADDECPNDLGSVGDKGCPAITNTPRPTTAPRATNTPRPTAVGDRDFDGVLDPNDACPDQGNEGLGIDNRGCPIRVLDSDGDGVPNESDACPNEGDQGLGLYPSGCPILDNDGDGVFNRDDNCPNEGSIGFGVYGDGCPILDGDNDGIPDPDDACPRRGDEGFGVYADGCPIPDSDGDGIPDPNDACPNRGDQGGGIDGNGCPFPTPTPFG